MARKPEARRQVPEKGLCSLFWIASIYLLLPGCSPAVNRFAPLGVEDAVHSIPQHYRVTFENDYVRVVEHRLPAHASEPLHAHPMPRVLYAISDSALRVHVGTDITSVSMKAGEAVWRGTQMHALENAGTQDALFLMVELKHDKPFSRPAGHDDDATQVAPQVYHLLLENEFVRAIEARLSPGQATPMHSHPGLALRYRISPMRCRITLPDGKIIDSETPAGAASWTEEPSQHAFENMGAEATRFLLVELK